MIPRFAKLALLSVALAIPTGCRHNLQRSYVESMEATRLAIEADVEEGLYKPDARSAKTLADWKEANEEAFKAPIREDFEREGNPYFATARLWDDGILLPSETRTALGLAFGACLNVPVRETRFGVFRM